MKRAIVAAFVAGSSLSFAPALADDAPRTVEIAITGGGAESALLEATIEELLDRVHLAAVHAPAAAGAPLLSRVTVDLSSASVAIVEVVDARDGRVLMSRELARDPNPSVAREEIAHAIQLAVEAELLKRESPPPSPPAASSPPPAPEAPPLSAPATLATPTTPAFAAEQPPSPPPGSAPASTRSTLTLDVATFASAGPVAKSSGVAPRVGGGVVVALASSSLRPSLALSAAYAPPFETGNDVIRARASFVSFRAVPAIEIVRTTSLALDWGAGGGFDVLTVAPQSDVLPTSRLGSSSSHADVILTSLLTLRADVVASVFFFASAGVEVDAFTRPYVVARGPVSEDLFVPWSVRPVLALGFAFTALGHR